MKTTFRGSLLFVLIKPIFFLIISLILFYFKGNIAIYIAKTLNFNALRYINYTIIFFLGIYIYFVFYFHLIKYELTTEQLIVTRGVFSVKINYLELYRIKDIEVQKPFFLRLIRVFNLILYTSDKTHYIFKIEGINLNDLPNTLRDSIEHNRKEKGVFEID